MKNEIMNYAQPDPAKVKGKWLGAISVAFAIALIPASWGVPLVVGVPLMAIAIVAGAAAIIRSRGRSVSGWLGLAISTYFVLGIIVMA